MRKGSGSRLTTEQQNIAATALFLANKTEENCRKTKDLIIAVAKVAQKNTKLIIDEQSKEYWKWRDSILAYEELMLEALTFDLMVDNPYAQLYEHFCQLELVHNKRLRDSAWAFLNDACLTVLPLVQPARDLAIAALFFATSATHEKIDDVRGEAWWRHLRGNEADMVRAVQLMTDFYRENPLRKQDAKIPGSPEFNLESTRRRGELSLSQMELDSSQYGTPTSLGTQSPKTAAGGGGGGGEGTGGMAKVNGKAENSHDATATNAANAPTAAAAASAAATKNDNAEVSSQVSRGDSDAALKAAANDLSVHEGSAPSGGGVGGGLVSPGLKRKSAEPEGEEDREAKKARLTDEDEGEIRSS